MNLSTLSSADLKHIAKLLKKRDAFRAQAAGIDRKLASFSGGSTGTTGGRRLSRPAGRKAEKKAVKRRAPRGELKGKILSALKKAGKDGLTVKDVVKKTGAKDANVRVWFHTTGKKVKEIKKLAPGKYGWNS